MFAQYRRGCVLQWNDGSVRHIIDVVSAHHVVVVEATLNRVAF